MNERFNVKRFLITLGIILIAVGATAGPLWYFMNQQNEQIKRDNQETIASLKTTSDKEVSELQKQIDEEKKNNDSGKTTVDKTLGWKSYTSTKAKINFKYPSEWFVEEQSGDNKNFVYIKYPNVGAPLEGAKVWVTFKYQPTQEGNFRGIEVGDAYLTSYKSEIETILSTVTY